MHIRVSGGRVELFRTIETHRSSRVRALSHSPDVLEGSSPPGAGTNYSRNYGRLYPGNEASVAAGSFPLAEFSG